MANYEQTTDRYLENINGTADKHNSPPTDVQTFVSQETIKNMQQQIMYHLKHFLNESKYTAFLLVLMLSSASLAWLLRFEWEYSVKWINRLLLLGMLILYYFREYFQKDWQDFISHSLLAMILVIIVLEVYFAFSDDRPLRAVLSAMIGMLMIIGVFDMFDSMTANNGWI